MKTITAEQAREISDNAEVDGFLAQVYGVIQNTANQGWRSCEAKILWDSEDRFSRAGTIVRLLRSVGYEAWFSVVDEDVATVGSNSLRETFVLFEIRW